MKESLPAGAAVAHYRIVSRLGAGGMGEVYLAQDTKLDRTVALKILPAAVAQDPDRMRRFVQEAKAASALSHPNVAHIYEIGEADGVSFLAMEYVEGQPLSRKIGGRPLEASEILEIDIQAADALDEAHSKGVTHRDIKPANIMITPRGQVKVLDFGLAKITRPGSSDETATEAMTAPGVILGTVQYMSPEQALGQPVDHRTDLFSLGAVLYEAATGRPRFSGTTPTETLSQVLHSQPEAIARLNYGISPELERIIRKCLEKDRERRYQSARELLVDLKNLKRDTGSAPAISASPRPRVSVPILTVSAGLLIALAAIGAYLWLGRGKPIDSLAVLPFVNVSADPNTEYLSDGITENLINSLSQIPKLRVVPRGRVFRYKGRGIDTEKVGRELNVRAVLTGKVVQRGDNLNIQTELVDVAGDSQLWGRQYNRKFSEIISVQEEIAKEVSEKLRLRPTGEEQKRLTKRYTENAEAHQLYLKGRYYWNRRTTETLKRGAEYFQQAIDKDPGYALAWAGLADCFGLYGAFEVLPPRDAAPKAKEAAGKALAIDDTLAEPHAALGLVKATYDWDWSEAEREFKRAIELSPNYPNAHYNYGGRLVATGRLDEAIAESKRAQEADPLSLIAGAVAGRNFYFARRYGQAIEQLRKTLEMDPNFLRAHWFLARAYEQAARHQEALAECKKALSLSRGET